MGKIRVTTDKMQNTAQELEKLGKRLDALESDIYSIRSNLRLKTNNASSIKQTLNNQAKSCDRYASQAKRLSSSLKEIVRLYEQAERAANECEGKEADTLRDKINKLRDQLKDIGGMLGIDTTALFSADPVNMSNGNYVYEKTFFQYSTALPMNFRMFYNACDTNAGTLGRGWRHSFERCLVEAGDEVRILDVDGSAKAFQKNESGRYIPFAGTFGSLQKLDNQWHFTDEEQDSYWFDAFGKLVKAVTPNGWQLELTYAQNLPISVTCSDCISLFFEYNEEKYLKKVSDQNGRTVSFFYENAFLVKVVDPEEHAHVYEYDALGRMCRVMAPNGDLAVYNEFDAQGRTTRQEFADGGVVEYLYDEEPNAIVMVRQNGSKVTYYHDDEHRNVRTVYTDGEERIEYNSDHQKTAIIDKLGRVNRYRYDDQGRLKEMVNPMGVSLEYGYNPNGQLEKLLLDGELFHTAEYDDRGHQVKSVNANGDAVFFTYDDMGRVQTVTHEDGSQTILKYDAVGNVIQVSDPTAGDTYYRYDDFRRAICSTDALGNETHYEYDYVDRLTKVINAEGHSRSYFYDKRNNLTRIVDFDGGVTELAYNNMNKLIRVTDPDGNTTRFEYDRMSNVTRKIAADGGVTELQYDDESRMIGIRHPMGGEETAEYDAVGNIITRTAPDGGIYYFQYDELNRPLQVIDPVGVVRRAEFNKLGKETAVYYGDGTEERFTYDKLGNCLSHTNQGGYTRFYRYNPLGKVTQVSDQNGILAEYTYGPGGKLLTEKLADGNCKEYTYNAAGNVISYHDNTKGTWNFRYNSLGKVCQSEHVGVGTEYYKYDAAGNICEVTDGSGNKTNYHYSKAGALKAVIDQNGNETRYEYDPCYRLSQIIQPNNGKFDSNTLTAANSRTTTYKWDLNGNLLSTTDNMGGRISYEYDACGRLIRKQDQDGHVLSCSYRPDGTEDLISFSDGRNIRYQYDALKRLSQIEDWLGITRMERDEMGRVTQVTEPDGTQIGYLWNDRGQCIEKIYPDGNVHHYEYSSNTLLSAFMVGGTKVNYDYYDNGLLQQKNVAGIVGSHYEYDTAGRITKLDFFHNSQNTDSFAYRYDSSSRKIGITERHENRADIEYGFAYTPVGALQSVTRNGHPYQSFEYDVFGNRTEMVEDGKRTEYGYDPLGQLQWSKSADLVKEYTYDKRGNLTTETVNGIQRLSMHFDALNRLSSAVSPMGTAEYTYNGMAMTTQVHRQTAHGSHIEKLVFDYTGSDNRLLARNTGTWENYGWDQDLLFSYNRDSTDYFLNDERSSTFGILRGDKLQRYAYEPFGAAETTALWADVPAFTGYRYDPITEYYDAGWRQYDPRTGRFVSHDPVTGTLDKPTTLNPYVYCTSDPINYSDPTGRIVAWLAGGIVGAVGNLGGKLAGDIVTSIMTGEPSFSSWQSYTGAAVGGFVQGSVFVVAGPTAAGAAGAATEKFVSNGLNMLTGVEGYRKEDGYNFGDLMIDTTISAGKGAVSGFAFDKVAKIVKIPGVTKDRGSNIAVWKQCMTKARKGLIKNVSLKTLGKGLLSYSVVLSADKMIVDLKDKLTEKLETTVKDFVIDKASDLIDRWFGGTAGGLAATSILSLFSSKDATCGTT